MHEPAIELSKDGADYARLSIHTVLPVNVTSSQSMGHAKSEAGISLQFSVDGKQHCVPLLSAMEIACDAVDEVALRTRADAIMRNTSVGGIPKKNVLRYLDPQSPHYATALNRITMMAQVAATNFSRDIAGLVKLYDDFTASIRDELPSVSSFQLQTAFGNDALLKAYRAHHNIAENSHPTLTGRARELLTRYKIACDHIPSYDPSRQAAVPLPAAPASLRAAFQASSYTQELQVIEQALQFAVDRGMIAPLTIDQPFREQMRAAIASARQSPSQASLAGASPNLGMAN